MFPHDDPSRSPSRKSAGAIKHLTSGIGDDVHHLISAGNELVPNPSDCVNCTLVFPHPHDSPTLSAQVPVGLAVRAQRSATACHSTTRRSSAALNDANYSHARRHGAPPGRWTSKAGSLVGAS